MTRTQVAVEITGTLGAPTTPVCLGPSRVAAAATGGACGADRRWLSPCRLSHPGASAGSGDCLCCLCVSHTQFSVFHGFGLALALAKTALGAGSLTPTRYMFDDSSSRVSLGGRSKGKTKERSAVVADARRARQQRAVAAAPSKNASALGRCLRGWMARCKLASLLRVSLAAAAQRSSAPEH